MNAAPNKRPTGTKQRSEAEEQFIKELEKYLGEKLSEQEKNLAIKQAEQVGDL
jgi:hypothetical protein